jgi:hypothetical protein
VRGRVDNVDTLPGGLLRAEMVRSVILLLCLAGFAAAQNTSTAPAGKYPALNIQVTVRTQEKSQPASFYRKTMRIIPTVTIEGAGRTTPIPAAEAVMLIITVNKAVLKVYSAETLPIPAANTGDRRQFSFAESRTFDDGELYKYYVLGLRDPVTKEIIDLKTNDVKLAELCKAHLEKRENFLNFAQGAEFPSL